VKLWVPMREGLVGIGWRWWIKENGVRWNLLSYLPAALFLVLFACCVLAENWSALWVSVMWAITYAAGKIALSAHQMVVGTLRAQIKQVEDVLSEMLNEAHSPDDDLDCRECGTPWPCAIQVQLSNLDAQRTGKQ